jgi:hypothetical protein
VYEDDYKKHRHCDGEHADMTARNITNFAVALSDKPTGTKQTITKAKSNTAYD